MAKTSAESRPIVDPPVVVPSLRDLCLRLVSESIINLDNAVCVLGWAKLHCFDVLAGRADKFVIESFGVLRERHSREELEYALGGEAFATLDKEQAHIAQSVARNRQLGSVISGPATATPSAVIGIQQPSSLRARAQSEAPPFSRPQASLSSSSSLSSAASSSSTAAPVRTPRRSFGGGGEKCAICQKTVYQAEKLATHGVCYHISCFRCATCSCKLTVSSFERDEAGKLYCKTHFMQDFLKNARGSATHLGAPIPPPPAPSAASSSADAAASSVAEARRKGLVSLGMSPAAPVAPSVGSWVASQNVQCTRCSKTVYAMERQDARSHNGDTLVFHKACFRCADCNTLLRPNNWELFDESVLCCQTHFQARRNNAATPPITAAGA